MDTTLIRKQYPALFLTTGKLDLPGGWAWLLEGLCHVLDEYMKHTEEGKRIYLVGTQQNRGRLVVMFTGGDSILRLMITTVEYVSKHVCQVCGEYNDIGQTGGWPVHTLCRNCWSHEPQYRMHHFQPYHFLPEELQTLKLAIHAMCDHGFRRALIKLL